jgi:hypothetical protein
MTPEIKRLIDDIWHAGNRAARGEKPATPPEAFYDVARFLDDEQFTGCYDKNDKPIMNGDLVFWDDNSQGKWSRIALVHWEKPSLIFEVVESPTKSVIGTRFRFGSFVYADTRTHLTIIKTVEEGLLMAQSLRDIKCSLRP